MIFSVALPKVTWERHYAIQPYWIRILTALCHLKLMQESQNKSEDTTTYCSGITCAAIPPALLSGFGQYYLIIYQERLESSLKKLSWQIA